MEIEEIPQPETGLKNPELLKKPENKEVNDQEFVKKMFEIFHSDIEISGKIFQDLQAMKKIDGPKLQAVQSETESIFRNYYKNSKELIPGIPLFFNESAESVCRQVNSQDLKHLNRDELPYKAQFGDWYYDGEFIKLYNEFVDHKNSRVNGQMTPEEIAFKEKIVQNFFPFGYGLSVDYGERLQSVKEDKKEFSKDNFDSSGRLQRTGRLESTKVRVDLFRKYLGLQQDYDSVIESPYKPTQAKNPDALYSAFDSKLIIAEIKNYHTIPQGTESSVVYGEREPINDFAQLEAFVQEKQKFPYNKFTSQLGKYVTNISYDSERGEKYISYYDVWDIDPPALKDMGIDLDQFNFPFEIYGRIYESDFK